MLPCIHKNSRSRWKIYTWLYYSGMYKWNRKWRLSPGISLSGYANSTPIRHKYLLIKNVHGIFCGNCTREEYLIRISWPKTASISVQNTHICFVNCGILIPGVLAKYRWNFKACSLWEFYGVGQRLCGLFTCPLWCFGFVNTRPATYRDVVWTGRPENMQEDSERTAMQYIQI